MYVLTGHKLCPFIMAQKFSKSFYNSKKWKSVQALYRQSKYGICERCGKPNGTIVHHKKYLTEENINDVNVSLSFDNLELLCQECHNHEHLKKNKSVRSGLRFTADGQLEEI